MIKKYKKKPVIIEAIQWNGENFDECMNFMGETYGDKETYECIKEKSAKYREIYIETLEGIMTASDGDYIIRGVNGEFYPCKPDIFMKSYEEVI